MKRIFKNVGIILLVSSLSACSSLVDLGSEQAPERVYLLKPYLTEAANSGQRTISVSVSSAPGLDTNKILILEPDAHLNHYASARWPDYTTEVFASLIGDALESSTFYSKVSQESSGSNDKLDLEIKALYTLNDALNNAESVTVVLQGHLECNAASTNIKLRSDIAVNQNKLSEIVAAYQTAVNDVSQQLLASITHCK